MPTVDSENIIPRQLSPEVLSAIQSVRFIAQHIKDADKDNEVRTSVDYKVYPTFNSMIFFPDYRGLEVCFDGSGPILPVGLYDVLHWWNIRHYISESISL